MTAQPFEGGNMDAQAIASSNPPIAATTVAGTAVPAQPAAPPAVANRTPAPPEPSLSQVTEAVNKINRSMATQTRGLEFSVDTDSKRTVVKVVDQQTKELIRQIPSVETLEIAHALDRAQGLLIKQQA
jgi:flagellar protein FlaG